MLLGKDELMALAEKYQAKADRAMERYQETGSSRYYNEAANNEDLADALSAAADASEDVESLNSIKGDLMSLAKAADEALHSDLTGLEAVGRNLVATAKIYGYKPIEDIR